MNTPMEREREKRKKFCDIVQHVKFRRSLRNVQNYKPTRNHGASLINSSYGGKSMGSLANVRSEGYKYGHAITE